MPSLTLYIRKENYVKLIEECQRLGIGESELVNKILEVYFRAREEKDISPSPRQLSD